MTLKRAWWLLAVMQTACGGNEPAPAATQSDVGAKDTSSPFLDLGAKSDSGKLPEGIVGPGADGSTLQDLPDGAAGNDTADVGPKEGGFGWKCTKPDDCESGFCVPTSEGLRCTSFCIADCPPTFQCSAIQQGADTVYICVQRTLNLCRPCTSHKDCASLQGVFSDYCVSLGAVEGSYCGIACFGQTDCPDGYQCAEAFQDEQGAPVFQCVPVAGQCTCSPHATQQAAETTCLSLSVAGQCPGKRQCDVGGLTKCDAPEPGEEFCNGKDDDCDGKTDEDLTGTACEIKNAFGSCKGKTFCDNGDLNCQGDPPKVEDCNGVDDNCDGKIDEGSLDSDKDGTADCVDNDDDDDGFQDDVDNCHLVPNPEQVNTDKDGQGDLCDNDDDNDDVPDALDNCAVDKNNDQLDFDGDKKGDVCDSDQDGDGNSNDQDNCPKVPNEDQADADADLTGDVCDPDDDNDLIVDNFDNCDLFPNPDQLDLDGDEKGDACDTDLDGDGKFNLKDNCKLVPNPDQSNFDGDALGDLCDADDDNDSIIDTGDNCPKAYNPEQLNSDTDGVGDACDSDDDNDDIPDLQDNCAKVANPDQADSDKDGKGDLCDGDTDGDKIPDTTDNCPLDPNKDQSDLDQDKKGDVCDDDDDGDGIVDFADNCAVVPNPTQSDLDQDSFGDQCDPDMDGDGVKNQVDNCPAVHNPEQLDFNLNGKGDPCDDDDDNDGVVDDKDNCAKIFNPTQSNYDGDAFGDDCDDDEDNDTKPDKKDNCPVVQNPDQKDTDVDGQGDACDDDDDNDGDLDSSDCGPTNPKVKHGVQELCNGIDDNCVFGADEEGSQGCTSHYIDKDLDGWGLAGLSKCMCDGGSGEYTASQSGDCDDANSIVHPFAPEICDGIDDNCDLQIDGEDSGGCSFYYFDKDGDSYGINDKKCLCKPTGSYKSTYQGAFDCNDLDPKVNPGAPEQCTGGDEDCDGKINEEGANGCKTRYPDADGDGFGAKVSGKCTCGPLAGYPVENNGDCYDGNKYAFPGNGGWYTSHRGDGSFDYDCDGAETREHTLAGGNCSTFLGFCSATQKGFKGGIPACGQSGSFLNDCDSGFFSCNDKNTTLIQRCH